MSDNDRPEYTNTVTEWVFPCSPWPRAKCTCNGDCEQCE